MGLVVNSKLIQQPTILVAFFQITEIIVRTRHIDIDIEIFIIFSFSGIFIIATSIVFIFIVINWKLAFKLDYQVL